MDVLPDDILIQIFGLFCFHCQHPGYFPHADTDETRGNKRTLAYLCRTSKDICAIAQPILYHYYATGNLKRSTKLYNESQDEQRSEQPAEPDLLPQFLRTAMSRPDLASRIVTMQIVHEWKLIGYEAVKPAIDALLECRLGKKLLSEFAKHWVDTLDTQRKSLYGPTLRVALTSLALALTPNLRSLLLGVDHGIGMPLTDCPEVRLNSLETLGLINHRFDYHMNELCSIYEAAPNLKTIYAHECGGLSLGPLAPPYASELKLQNLRKLSVSGLTMASLEELFEDEVTPNLEDLECFYLDWGPLGYPIYLDDVLQPLQKSLRRLCASFLPRITIDIDGDGHHKWTNSPDANFIPFDTLESFEKLEDLTVDCRSVFYRDSVDASGQYTLTDAEPREKRLSDMLPRCLRRLRISFIYRNMERDMRQLAECRAERFPCLATVVMGVMEGEIPLLEEVTEELKATSSLPGADHISFTAEIDRLGPDPWTMIPGGTPGSKLVALPGTRNTPCLETCCYPQHTNQVPSVLEKA